MAMTVKSGVSRISAHSDTTISRVRFVKE